MFHLIAVHGGEPEKSPTYRSRTLLGRDARLLPPTRSTTPLGSGGSVLDPACGDPQPQRAGAAQSVTIDMVFASRTARGLPGSAQVPDRHLADRVFFDPSPDASWGPRGQINAPSPIALYGAPGNLVLYANPRCAADLSC